MNHQKVKNQRKKGYNAFRFDPYPNDERVGLKNQANIIEFAGHDA